MKFTYFFFFFFLNDNFVIYNELRLAWTILWRKRYSSDFAVTFNLFQLIIWLILYDHNNQHLPSTRTSKQTIQSYIKISHLLLTFTVISSFANGLKSNKIYLITLLRCCMFISTNFFWLEYFYSQEIVFRPKCMSLMTIHSMNVWMCEKYCKSGEV